MKLKLHTQILLAMALAVLVGSLASHLGGSAESTIVDTAGFLGSLFIQALKMLIVPLIFAAMINGMSNVGKEKNVGRLGGRTLAYYMITSLLAILVGLAAVNITQPGIVDGQPAKDIIGATGNVEEVVKKVEGRGAGDVIDIFKRMIPANVVHAAAEGQMLGLIFFSLLFGFFLSKGQGKHFQSTRDLFTSLFDIMMSLTNLVMKFAPIGVFGLVTKVVATTGFEAFQPVMVFFFTVLAALAIHALVVIPLILKYAGKINSVSDHYRAMAPALLTAFSTASSSATLPTTMNCVEKNAGVSNRTTSFVLPLGATVNMDGTALYECVAAMFIAQAYGLELTLTVQFTIVWIALITSIGVAGIPAASLVAIVLILTVIGLPVEAIGLILVVDRLLDMVRTAVNVLSDTAGAVVIAKGEGEKVGYPMELAKD